MDLALNNFIKDVGIFSKKYHQSHTPPTTGISKDGRLTLLKNPANSTIQNIEKLINFALKQEPIAIRLFKNKLITYSEYNPAVKQFLKENIGKLIELDQKAEAFDQQARNTQEEDAFLAKQLPLFKEELDLFDEAWLGNTLFQFHQPLSAGTQQAIELLKKGTQLSELDSKYRCNKYVVLTAVRLSGWALRGAADELKKDPEVVKIAVAQYGGALQYAAPALRADKEIVKIASSSKNS